MKEQEISKFYRLIANNEKDLKKIEDLNEKLREKEGSFSHEDFSFLFDKNILPLLKKYGLNFNFEDYLEYYQKNMLNDEELKEVSGGNGLIAKLGSFLMSLLSGGSPQISPQISQSQHLVLEKSASKSSLAGTDKINIEKTIGKGANDDWTSLKKISKSGYDAQEIKKLLDREHNDKNRENVFKLLKILDTQILDGESLSNSVEKIEQNKKKIMTDLEDMQEVLVNIGKLDYKSEESEKEFDKINNNLESKKNNFKKIRNEYEQIKKNIKEIIDSASKNKKFALEKSTDLFKQIEKECSDKMNDNKVLGKISKEVLEESKKIMGSINEKNDEYNNFIRELQTIIDDLDGNFKKIDDTTKNINEKIENIKKTTEKGKEIENIKESEEELKKQVNSLEEEIKNEEKNDTKSKQLSQSTNRKKQYEIGIKNSKIEKLKIKLSQAKNKLKIKQEKKLDFAAITKDAKDILELSYTFNKQIIRLSEENGKLKKTVLEFNYTYNKLKKRQTEMLNSIKDVQKKFDYLQKQQIKFLIKAESNISKIKRFRLNKTYSIKELSFKLGISTHTIKHLNNLNDQSDNYILKSESKLQLPELTVRHRTRDKDMMRLA